MAVTSSGEIKLISDVNNEINGNTTDTNVSLTTLSTGAGKDAPHGLTEFYGYASFTNSDNFGVSTYRGNSSTNIMGSIYSGAHFNGSSSKIQLADNTFKYTALTISAWILPMGSGDRCIIETYNYTGSPGSQGWILKIDNATGKLLMRAYHGDCGTAYPTDNSCNNVTEVYSNSAISTSEWTHIAVTLDSSNMKMYINGTAQTGNTGLASNGFSYNATTKTTIGCFRYGTAADEQFYHGSMDQIRMYDSVLTASEITSLYNESFSSTASFPSGKTATAVYTFDGDSNDSTGSHNASSTSNVSYFTPPYKFSACGTFNGSDTSINIPMIRQVIENNFSISLWLKTPTSFASSGYPTVMSLYGYAGSGSAYGWSLEYPNTGKLMWYWVHANSADSWIKTSTLKVDTWYHVVVTKSSSAANIYINGSLDNAELKSGGNTHTMYYNNFNDITIGAKEKIDGGTIDGHGTQNIDQIRIYNSILSSSDVTALYNETLTDNTNINFPTGKTATAIYRLNGDAKDETGAHDGTETNMHYTKGFEFTPDLVWFKARTDTRSHSWVDSVRGFNGDDARVLQSGSTSAQWESAYINGLRKGGFALSGSENYINNSSHDYVAWGWKAGGSSNTFNIDGTGYSTRSAASLDSGTIADAKFLGCSTNTKAGFSIIHYNGSGASSGQTIDTGLTSSIELMIIKGTGSGSWITIDSHTNKYHFLNTDAAGTSATFSNYASGTMAKLYDFAPFVHYCFHSVAGYQKIGTYTATGSAGTPLIETGFKPAFLLLKNTARSNEWIVLDHQRDNATNSIIPHSTGPENTSDDNAVTLYDNGFAIASSGSGVNYASGDTFLYLAIAQDDESPSTPVLADSFKVLQYTGDGTISNKVSGVGFTPDLIWIKARNATVADESGYNVIVDKVRGARMTHYTNLDDNQLDRSSTEYAVKSINNDGFTVGDVSAGDYSVNGAAGGTYSGTPPNYIAYNWKAGNSNKILTAGTRNVIANVNAAAGLSIVKLNKPDTNTDTYAHGLGAVPEMIWLKRLNDPDDNWHVYHKELGNTVRISMDSDAQQVNGTGVWGSTTPTSTLFTLQNQNGGEHIAYCWKGISGYSHFGKYTGTGTSGSNSITGLGFQPDFVLYKAASRQGNWLMFDSVRGAKIRQTADNDWAESNWGTGGGLQSFDTDGFTVKDSDGTYSSNVSGETYIYAAWKMN